MNDECDEDVDIPLRVGLDLDELRLGEGQMFEVDSDRMIYDGDEDTGFCRDGYRYFGQDFCEEEDRDEDEGGLIEFDAFVSKMVNITADGGVKKQVLVQGLGEVVPSTACVTISYNAYLDLEDHPFDSTVLRDAPYRFSLGTGMVIPGLDIAVSTMRKKEKSRFLISSDYGLGDCGCPPRIPGKATCLYVVELVNFSEAEGVDAFYCLPKDKRSEVPFERILKVIKHEREDAQAAFNNKQYHKASKIYRRVMTILINYSLKDEAEEQLQQKQLLKVYQNLAVTTMKLSNNYGTIKFANEALRLDPNCVKAFYLKGKALRILGEFDKALAELRKAHRLNNSSKEIAQELAILDVKKKKFDDFERSTCQRMFGLSNDTSSTGTKTASVSSNKDQEVSDDFKAIVRENLETFKNDADLSEYPFSTNSITLPELRAVSEIAVDIGLHVTKEICQDKVTHIRVCKNVPEAN